MSYQVWINESGSNWERYSRVDHASREAAEVEARDASDGGTVRVGITENDAISKIDELPAFDLRD